MFAVVILGPLDETRRHLVGGTPIHVLRDIAQEGLIAGFQRHVFIGQKIPSGGLAFRYAEVVAAGHQSPGQAANGLIRHRPVIVGQNLLADFLVNGVKTCTGVVGEDDAFH